MKIALNPIRERCVINSSTFLKVQASSSFNRNAIMNVGSEEFDNMEKLNGTCFETLDIDKASRLAQTSDDLQQIDTRFFHSHGSHIKRQHHLFSKR